MLLTPCGVDDWNTLLYHLKPLQLSFFPFFLFSSTLSEGYNTHHFTIQPIRQPGVSITRSLVLQ
jgi:hypothetical protein